MYPVDKFADKFEWVYIIYNHSTQLVKIGISNNVNTRFKELRTAGGCELSLLMAIQLEPFYDEKACNIEKYLHQFYKPKRQIGEWFNLSLRDIVDIRKLFWSTIEGWDIVDNISNGGLGNILKGKYQKSNALYNSRPIDIMFKELREMRQADRI